MMDRHQHPLRIVRIPHRDRSLYEDIGVGMDEASDAVRFLVYRDPCGRVTWVDVDADYLRLPSQQVRPLLLRELRQCVSGLGCPLYDAGTECSDLECRWCSSEREDTEDPGVGLTLPTPSQDEGGHGRPSRPETLKNRLG